MRFKDGLLILGCLFFLITGTRAQDINFKHLTTNDGLTNNVVLSIYQDERGFLWFGTRNGVSLYNGYEFVNYRFQKNTSNSLIYNNIPQITGNGKGEIYFMTSKGISMFNISKNDFSILVQGYTKAMFFHKSLYVAIQNCIYLYNGSQLTPYYELPDKEAKITAIQIEDDQILIGTEKQGLYIRNKQNKLTHPIPTGNISTIFKENDKKYWIGTWEYGLYRIDGTTITNYQNDERNSASISSNFVRSCCLDKSGNLWIGTFNGLNRFDPKTQTFVRHLKSDNDGSLTHTSIWNIICDRQGTIWLGTYFGGVNYFNPESQIYHHYRQSKVESKGLSSATVGKMVEDNEHNLWICTEGGGLNKLDRSTGTFKWYKAENGSNSLSHDNVKAIHYDHQQEIMWIGTHLGGLNKLDIKTGKFTHYNPMGNDKDYMLSNIIRDILPYKEQLLLATPQGLYLFDPKTGTSKRMLQSKTNNVASVQSLFIDHRGLLWICGTENGTYSYDMDTRKLVNYKHNLALEKSISSNNINSIFEDSQKRLWFCTNESGIDLYNFSTDNFENLDVERNDLASNTVYDACELSPNRILFITDGGFSILDLATRKFKNYNQENGIPLTAINEHALYKTSDGEIFIGGVQDGMVSFHEKDINYTPNHYNILPFRLIVNGNEIKVNDDTQILRQELTETKGLTLKYSQSMFSIEYAVSNYIASNNVELEYCLQGFSNTWNSTRGQHTITYTNLNPGKYTLIVRAKNQLNTSIPESRLEIEILPPFYRTTLAYLLYLVLISAILYYLIRVYNNRIKLQESLKYEKQRAEDIETLNQVKLRFFTNISHEFRTPLTLIIGQMEMLLQARSFAPTIYNRILGVYKNCLQLRELITELLDFRKQEQGYMTIKVREHNIVDFIYENYLLFQSYAAQRQIQFNFRKTNDVINVWYDTKQMQKVMNNLVSNAFKHTKEGGEISVSIRKGNREVIIEVTDNGSGILPKDIDKIFNRFYQTEQMESINYVGTGIGLSLTKGIIELHHGTIEVYSEPNEETTFSIHLKTGKEHFEPEQINEHKEEAQNVIEGQFSETQQELLLEQEIWPPNSIEKIKESKILIVEDNNALRDMLAKIFETFYTVITATNGKEGLEKLNIEQPNIVLSDVVMPEMSGIELCKEIKGNMETCHIPVVLLTARTAIEYNLEGLRMGADDYITKPFNINILLSRCNNLVNNRIILQEKFSKHPQVKAQILATNPMDKELIDKAVKVIEQYIDNVDFNVDILAKEIGIARTKLFTKLKAITGQTPYDFILTVRLKQAAILLKEHPELNVSEISDRLGFSSPRQFSKSFKEKYNVVPQAYRRGESSETNTSDEIEDETDKNEDESITEGILNAKDT